MSGIFPLSTDGGLPPNPAQPNNPTQAFPPTFPPINTDALYYGNGCDVRLRPHVVNSIISEIAATADRAARSYDPSSLHNLETAVRYLIQRGLARAALLLEQTANHYTGVLDPPAAVYNDYMTISFVPQMSLGPDNQGLVRINLSSLGYVPLLRNDGEEMQAGDLHSGIPFIGIYYKGAFYYVGLVRSQLLTEGGGGNGGGEGPGPGPGDARHITGVYFAESYIWMPVLYGGSFLPATPPAVGEVVNFTVYTYPVWGAQQEGAGGGVAGPPTGTFNPTLHFKVKVESVVTGLDIIGTYPGSVYGFIITRISVADTSLPYTGDNLSLFRPNQEVSTMWVAPSDYQWGLHGGQGSSGYQGVAELHLTWGSTGGS